MNYLIPYDFVLQMLYPFKTTKRKMLGGYALYANKKLLMLLRESVTSPEFNGVFVATVPEFFKELQDEIHTSRMEFDLDGSRESWIFISEDLDDFKTKVQKACELIKQGDERMGK
jgi:hypothetical protein